MTERISLGKFIAGRRKYLGMTQVELAEKIGVSKSAIAKWETDGGIPDRDNLRRISETINVTVDELHKIMRNSCMEKTDLEINITPDIIAALESYGYKVIRPSERR